MVEVLAIFGFLGWLVAVLCDWLSGLPFEVATPAQLFEFHRGRGFHLEKMLLRPGHGCNELVFSRTRRPGALRA